MDGSPRLTLEDVVTADPSAVMGATYATTHWGLGRLAKVYDYATRLPYHIHPRLEHARLVGRKSKEEANHFPPDVDLGRHPETFFGVHPWIAEQRRHEVLLPYLVDWDSDLILRHSRAELEVPDEGFHVPAGILHAPGTAVTIESRVYSDVYAMLQAVVDGYPISKELLFHDVRPADRTNYGEAFLLGWPDWELNGDPYFYENRHLSPRLIDSSRQTGGEECWIYYNTLKFSGKKFDRSPSADLHDEGEGGLWRVRVEGAGELRRPLRSRRRARDGRAAGDVLPRSDPSRRIQRILMRRC